MNEPYRIDYQKSDQYPNGLDFDKYKYIFKFDENNTGAKISIGVNDFTKFLENQYSIHPKNFYQVVRKDRVVREYYDIDMEGKFHEEDWDSESIRVIKDFLYHRNNTVSHLPLTKDDFIILTAHKRDKLSFHFYSKQTCFESVNHHKEFASRLKEKFQWIDLAVYSKNRALRLVGNSKYGQNRPLTPYPKTQSVSILDMWVELPKKHSYVKIDVPEYVKPLKLKESESFDHDLEEQEWFKEFLKTIPEYTYCPSDHKLRRDGNYPRSPCLIEPNSTHGTENLIINRYKGIYYVNCFQHKGKYKIPGQTPQENEWWNGEIFNHSICAKYVKTQLENELFFTETHKWIIFNPKLGTWSANNDQVNILERVCKILRDSIPDSLQDKELYKIAMRRKTQVGMTGFLQGIIKMLESILLDHSIMEKLDSYPHLFAFNDGWLFDLKQSQYRKIEKQDYILTTCGLSHPTQDIDCDPIDALVLELFGDSELVKSYLSSIACYLYGENINEKFIIYTGIGRNGKGVMDSILQKMLGDYYSTMSVNQLTDMNQTADRANSELASTQYSRCVMTHEPESCNQASTLKVGIIKKLTGRDSITTRFLYGQKFSFKPKFTPTIQANEMPNLSKRDDAISKRLVKINFPFQFVEQPTNDYQKPLDIHLKERVVEDDRYAYGLFQRALEVWLETKGKIYISDSVKKETEDYLREQNPLREWFESNFETIDWDTNNNISSNQMFEYYKSDTGGNLTQTKFSSLLKELCQWKKTKLNNIFSCQRKKLSNLSLNPLE